MRMPRGYLKMSGANAAKPYFDCVQARFSGSFNPNPHPRANMSSEQQNDILSINQVQLLLSEKRTALSVMRTGIAVLALPLSIFSALIATSKWYNMVEVWPLLMLVVGINLGLAVFGVYLIARSMQRMRQYDRLIADIKHSHDSLRRLIKS